MPNFNEPNNAQQYTSLLESIRAMNEALAKMDFTGVGNIPVGTISYNAEAQRLKLRNASGGDVDLPLVADTVPDNSIGSEKLKVVPVAKGGTGATSVTDARSNLGLGTSATKNSSSSVSSNSTGTVADSLAVKTAYDKAVEAYQLANSGSGAYAPISHTHSYLQISGLGTSATKNSSDSYSTNSSAIVATAKAVYDAKKVVEGKIPAKATVNEVKAGVDDTKFVTSAGVSAAVGDATAIPGASPILFTSPGITTWVANCNLALVFVLGGGGGGGAYGVPSKSGSPGGASSFGDYLAAGGSGGHPSSGSPSPGQGGSYLSGGLSKCIVFSNGHTTSSKSGGGHGDGDISVGSVGGAGASASGYGNGGGSGNYAYDTGSTGGGGGAQKAFLLRLEKGSPVQIVVGAGGAGASGQTRAGNGSGGAVRIYPIF